MVAMEPATTYRPGHHVLADLYGCWYLDDALEIERILSRAGYRILEAREYMWSDKIIGGMLTIGVLGLIIDGAMSRLNDHLLRWHRGLER